MKSLVTIPCLKGSATHCSHDAAAKCCRKGQHKFKPITSGKGRMIREVGRCGHVLTRAQGFSRSYNVECGDVADSPCHERKPLGAYRPDKFGGNATWRPRAWTGPVPRDVMARYCDDGALAARLCERIAQSLAEVAA